jgi:epsin
MGEIADLTYNVVAFTEIMQMVWKRLNDHGKNWRHVYKSLVLLEYLIKTGSEKVKVLPVSKPLPGLFNIHFTFKVAQQCKENIFVVQTLKDFQHLEDNKDLVSKLCIFN